MAAVVARSLPFSVPLYRSDTRSVGRSVAQVLLSPEGRTKERARDRPEVDGGARGMQVVIDRAQDMAALSAMPGGNT